MVQNSLNPNAILEALGGYGKFQILIFLGLGFIYMRGAWQVFVILFIGAFPSFSCNLPADNETVTYRDGECKIHSVADGGLNRTETCSYGYTYGSEFESTIVTEWDLVCGNDYLVDLSSTIYMVGNSLGAVLLTPLSDRYGRKWVILVCLLAQTALGVGVSFVHSIAVFTTLRFFVGFLNMAIALTTYVMVTEIFAATHRSRPPVVLGFFWSLGLILLSVLGYLVTDWRWLNLIITLPNLLVFFYIWFLPESIPWLISKNKTKEVKSVVKKAVLMNNIPFPSQLFQDSSPAPDELSHSYPDVCSPGGEREIENTSSTASEIHESKPGADTHFTVVSLFKTTLIRRYTVILFYLWFVNSLGYFGILFSTPTLSGNIYLNLGISGAVEIPATVICMFALDYFGRKKPLIFFLTLCGVMNILTIFIPAQTDSGTDLSPLIITMAMIGKFGITGAYSTIYLYSTEIFPTAIRNHAVGLSSFWENLGGISAPFIVYGAKSLAKMPLVLFGVLTIVGAILAIFLPETKGRSLPETIEDVEQKSIKRIRHDNCIDETEIVVTTT